MQGDPSINSKQMEELAHPEDERHKYVFMSAVTRMVFKRGRLTVPPQRALEICGILSVECPTASSRTADRAGATDSAIGCPEWTLEEIESSRYANLPVVRLERGWDAVRELFRQERVALTEHRGFMW
ncbi:hypothetical protein N7537_010872 [Penicillium hordei]|uniref:Uncharacterized protein n=1 Tax=Penicillium hordei TaxID=40994 RepID=A0AAD6GU69_9EURO|nr:uncharacterized protein N7537_010872 [Penicillium hordei]KAJ5588194.1 hypothetical protein N7537_010872 [Penicillium hordei]